MKRIIIAGAGAHCKVTLDILLDSGEYEPAGLLDEQTDRTVLGIPIIGTDNDLTQLYMQGIRYGFVAVGDNAIRKKIQLRMEKIGFQMATLCSRYAVISRFAQIEQGSLIMPGAVVNAGAKIGKGCILNTNCSVDHDCVLGDFVHIAPGCAVSGTTQIGEGSFLGTGARVIDRLTVGKWIVLGAGAVAVRDIPDGCTAVGVPAKVIKTR